MKAILVFREKMKLADGGIVEMVIWKLPESNEERPHGLKYSLFYGISGRRIVGYDNELGKGDHKYINDQEYPYQFESVERLITDFMSDVEVQRAIHNE